MTASERGMLGTGSMVKEFGVRMGCPSCQSGTGTRADACRARLLSGMARRHSAAPQLPEVDTAVA